MMSLPVTEFSQVGAARRRALQEAATIGMTTDECDRLAIVVTEVATNLVRHAKGGEIVLMPWRTKTGKAFDLVAMDEGPGLGNVEAAIRDGFTTAEGESLGTGLGAVARMSDHLDIFSDSSGTVISIRIGSGRRGARPFETVGLIVPKPGYDNGGDAFGIREEPTATFVMLMDVLGHGPAAAEEAKKGVAAFLAATGASLEETERSVSAALEGGRGAAALFVMLPHDGEHLSATGLGNVRGEIVRAGGTRHGIASTPGIVGAGTRRPGRSEHEFPTDATLILSTDGLKTGERENGSAPLFFREPATIAGALYKRRRRGSDDSGIVVARASRADA